MRVSAIALFAGAVAAKTLTDTVTFESTIYSCAPTVTDCPYASHSSTAVEVTTGYEATTTAESSAVETTAESSAVETTVAVSSVYSSVSGVPSGYANGTSAAVTTAASSAVETAPGYSTSVIAVTTCVPTVSYSTITYYPETTAPSYAPSSTGKIPYAGNNTIPASAPTSSLIEANGAGTLKAGGAAIAAVAGLVAFLL